jgi:hypothetical protein
MYNTTSQPDPILNRVYLGTFILDTLLSSYLGIPTVSTQHIMPVLSAYEADGPEEWDTGPWDLNGTAEIQCPSRSMSIFGQLAGLMVVLNAATALGGRTVSADDKLSEWLDQLPKHCSPKERLGPLTPPLANLEMIYWSIKAYVSGEPHTRTSSLAEYTRTFGTHASKSMLHICHKLSTHPMHGAGYERAKRPVNEARDDIVTETGILPDLSFSLDERARSGLNDTQHSIDGIVTHIPASFHNHPLTRSRHSPVSYVMGGERPHPHVNETLHRDLDDTETMQTMLEDILAHEAGKEPFFSNFMQDLGFFDEDVSLPGGSV